MLDDIQQQIDDLNTTLDSTSSSVDDQSNTIDDHENRLGTVEDTTSQIDPQRVNQLNFPLDQDTIDLIREVFPSGTAQFVATGGGSIVSVTDSRIGTKTGVLFSIMSNNCTGTPIRGYSISGNTITFKSTDATDTSTLVYQLITLP